MEGSSDLKLRTLLCLLGLACMSQCVGHTNKARPSPLTSGVHSRIQRFKSYHCQMLEEASNLKRDASASKYYGACYQIQRVCSEFFSCPTHSCGKLRFHIYKSMKSCMVEFRNVRRLFSTHSKMVDKHNVREDQHEDDVISELSATDMSMADRTPKTTASFCDSSTPLSCSGLFNLWISLCDTIWCTSKELPTALTSDLRRIRLLFCIIILCYAVTPKNRVKTEQTLSLKPIWRSDHLSAMFDASPKMISGKYVNVKKQCFYDWLFLPFREVAHLKDLIVLPVLEMKRLASFRSMSYAEIPDSMFFTKLAEAGFFYTGTGNEVTCSGCQSTLNVASIGSDASDPRYHRESCRFVTATELAGHPVVIVSQPDDGFQEAGTEDTFEYEENGSKFDPSRELAPSHARRFQRSLSSSSTSSNSSGYSSASISSPSSRRGSHNLINQESVSENQPSQTDTSSNGATLSAGATNNSNGQQESGRLILTNPSYPVYISKQKRLESFTNWTAGHIHAPMTLASAGFFYAGYGDCVRCFQCGLGLRSWKPGDDINEEHERHRPSCPFLRVQKNNSNTSTSIGGNSVSREAGHPASRAGNSSNHERNVSTATLNSEVDESRGKHSVTPQQASHARENVIRSSGETKDLAENVTINALQRENETLQLQMMCKICLTAPIRDLFLPCGDLYACTECSKNLTHCPACNKLILATVTTYFS